MLHKLRWWQYLQFHSRLPLVSATLHKVEKYGLWADHFAPFCKVLGWVKSEVLQYIGLSTRSFSRWLLNAHCLWVYCSGFWSDCLPNSPSPFIFTISATVIPHFLLFLILTHTYFCPHLSLISFALHLLLCSTAYFYLIISLGVSIADDI